jgi:hypothetical protein
VAKEGNTLHTTSAHKHDPSVMARQRQSLANRGVKDIGKMPMDVFKQEAMYEYLTPSMIEERMRNGATNADLREMKSTLESYLVKAPQINGPWARWESGNSTYAAQFFNV